MLIIAYTIILGFYISWVSVIGFLIIMAAAAFQVFVGSFIGKLSKSKFMYSDTRNK